MLCGISCELAGFVHRPIVDSESAEAKPNLSQLYLSRLSLAKPAKLNFFKTLDSGFFLYQLMEVGGC
jgi:hypothetical protein